MFYQVMAILLMGIFYLLYFVKFFVLKRQEIKVNNLGVGNKERKVLVVERLTSMATIMICIVEFGSIFFVRKYIADGFRILGFVLGVVGIVFFAMALVTMKNSWRVGIPEEKTTLISKGIYRFSRNPAFVGFDLLYVSLCMMFLNAILLVSSIFAIGMLHFQILQEEKHMEKMFGNEYETYKRRTPRYLLVK